MSDESKQLAARYEPSGQLAEELQAFVKKNLAAHEYPREIEFVDDLPMTTTGKIIRRKFSPDDLLLIFCFSTMETTLEYCSCLSS